MLPAMLPDRFAATRAALHAVAEHVLCAARHRVTGRIGLRVTPGGFGTPPFGDDEAVRVDVVELVHRRGTDERRAALKTLGAAAAFVGVPLGAPREVFTPSTDPDPDAPLDVDAGAARALAGWYEFSNARLVELRDAFETQRPSEIQLWPEHFDVALDLGDADAGTRANFGASPGDGAIAEPYLYIGPWDAARRTGVLGGFPFGAARTYGELRHEPDPVAAARRFLRDGAEALFA